MSEFNLRKYLKENRLGQSPLYRGPRQSLGEANEGQGIFPKSKEEVDAICKKLRIRGYTINNDMSIDVEGHVDIAARDLDFIPVKFNSVTGIFNCSENNLTSLEGCPDRTDDFSCTDNNLTSLKGGPQTVEEDYDCRNNQLESLEGAPQEEVGGYFSCGGNGMKSLKGSPKLIGGDFDCSDNELTSLEGGPKKIVGDLECSNNNLTSLDGLPKVGGKVISDLKENRRRKNKRGSSKLRTLRENRRRKNKRGSSKLRTLRENRRRKNKRGSSKLRTLRESRRRKSLRENKEFLVVRIFGEYQFDPSYKGKFFEAEIKSQFLSEFSEGEIEELDDDAGTDIGTKTRDFALSFKAPLSLDAKVREALDSTMEEIEDHPNYEEGGVSTDILSSVDDMEDMEEMGLLENKHRRLREGVRRPTNFLSKIGTKKEVEFYRRYLVESQCSMSDMDEEEIEEDFMEFVDGEDYEKISREVELGDDFEEESFDMESLDEYDDGMGGPARDRGHSADAGLDEIIRMLKQLKMKGGELSKEALKLIKDKMNLEESNLNENEEGSLQGNVFEDYITGLFNDSVSEEGGIQSGVWKKSEYGTSDYYESETFLELIDYLKNVGGEETLEGNPDINLKLVRNGDIRWDANVTLNENEEDKDGGGIDDLDDDELSGFEADAEDGQELSLHLQQALELAKELGDEKLITQIGNTITFYTRNNILK